jgi:hypothetical protein
MKTMRWVSSVGVVSLLFACSNKDQVRDAGPKDGPAALADLAPVRDTAVTDLGRDSLETPAPRDAAAEVPAADLAPEVTAVADGAPDVAAAEAWPSDSRALVEVGTEAAGIDLGPSWDSGAVEAPIDTQAETVKPDSAAPDTGPDAVADAPPPPNLTCRNDADCCIVIDNCMAIAYLYSKAPGATGVGFGANDGGVCLACIPPAVQVRCASGQCVGEKLSSVYEGALVKNHCGPVILTDAGTASPDQVAYAGAPQTSWSCGGP